MLEKKRATVRAQNEVTMKHIYVAAAIIIKDGKILCTQRGKNKHDYISYKFEFPGGKLEPGEDGKTALTRELEEEMKLTIPVEQLEYFMTVEHEYPDFAITMHSYLCPLGEKNFDLLEHVSAKWLPPRELGQLDWAGADKPIVEELMNQKL